MREVSKQGSWGPGNTILVGNNIMFIKLSDDRVEEIKIRFYRYEMWTRLGD